MDDYKNALIGCSIKNDLEQCKSDC